MAHLLKSQLHCIAPGNSYRAGCGYQTLTWPRVWDPLGAPSMLSCSAEPELSLNSGAKSSRRTFIPSELQISSLCSPCALRSCSNDRRGAADRRQGNSSSRHLLCSNQNFQMSMLVLFWFKINVWILKLQHSAFLAPQVLFLLAACISLQ